MSTFCPYCHIEVSESSIEAEDGCCPECGAVITPASTIFDDGLESDEVEDVFDDFDDDFDDDFGDLDDDLSEPMDEADDFEDDDFDD